MPELRNHAEQVRANCCGHHQDYQGGMRADRFLRLQEVRNRVPFGRATIYRLVASGEFPKPYALGARAVGWLESEISNWIASRVAAARPEVTR